MHDFIRARKCGCNSGWRRTAFDTRIVSWYDVAFLPDKVPDGLDLVADLGLCEARVCPEEDGGVHYGIRAGEGRRQSGRRKAEN